MKVFRCISAREITNVYKGINERIAVAQGENTHQYQEGNYYHFFRYSQFAEKYFEANFAIKSAMDRYVLLMVANIPNDILDKYQGYGFYYDEVCNCTIPIPEYAIPESELKPEYIVTIHDYISPEYASDKNEYQRYIDFVRDSMIWHNYQPYAVINEIERRGLQNILEVTYDNRKEEEIKAEQEEKNKVKEYSKKQTDHLF